MAAKNRIADAPEEFDIVLTDLSMPDVDGLQLAVWIRGIRPDLPVLLMTGFTDRASPDELDRSGIAGVLQKPFRGADLKKALEEILSPGEPAQ